MKSNKGTRQSEQSFLGIDGGGTRTVALAVSPSGQILRRLEAGPANVKIVSDEQLVAHFRTIAADMPKPTALCIGLAGAWAEPDLRRIRKAAALVWPDIPCHATNDLEIALQAGTKDSATPTCARVLLVSGTGSCAFGKNEAGAKLKIGGWGHILGDKGSAYQIGMSALRKVVDEYDRTTEWPALGQRLLRALLLNEPSDLIGWAQSASKTDIAGLAIEVFAAEKQHDKLAREILNSTLDALAEKASLCSQRIARRSQPIEFVFAGSVLLKQPLFAQKLARRIRQQRPGSIITPLARENVWGAVEFARSLSAAQPAATGSPAASALPVVRSREMSPTERRNPRSMRLDKLSLAAAVKLMITEDGRIHRATLAQHKSIERALTLIVKAFRSGGRLFYVGAGTSGRLGVLDASECPVTFRSPPEMIQGIIAGGQIALWKPVEGAEDDAVAGANALVFRGVNKQDVVLGIAASGTTRYVWGALQEAKRRGARTVLLAFNPYLEIPLAIKPDVCITPDLGPEVLTGSTRLKAGSATKLVLNTLTTLAMVQIGKVSSNLMVDVIPTNVKLRDRAARIVMELTGVDYARAQKALQTHGWIIKKAAASLSKK